MAKFCSKCGNELKEGARFCSVCGNPVKQVQSAQSEATAGTNEERQGVSSQQQGFTAQDMQYQQMAGSAAPVKKNKNLWLLAIPAAILVILLVIFGIKAVLSPAYLKPVKYMEKAFNKQDINLMKKAVPDEYAEWMTDDIVDYMFDLDSDYKITIKVTDKEKIAKKDLEETLIDDYYVLDSIAEDAKAGYILEAEATLKQDGEKDTQDITLVVVKVDGKWVIVAGLLNNEKKDGNKSYAGTDKGKQTASSVIGGHNCSITCRKHCNRNIWRWRKES